MQLLAFTPAANIKQAELQTRLVQTITPQASYIQYIMSRCQQKNVKYGKRQEKAQSEETRQTSETYRYKTDVKVIREFKIAMINMFKK